MVISSDGTSNYYNTHGITDDQLHTAGSSLQGGKDGVNEKPGWASSSGKKTPQSKRSADKIKVGGGATPDGNRVGAITAGST